MSWLHMLLEKIEISFDDGKSTLNFVEAALFIQGSACVYSKKVEYLYALAVATLEMIMSRKKQQQASSIDDQGRDKDITFDQHTEHDDLLDLDDIKESDNIELKDEAERSKGVHIIPRIPFALMPKNDMNRRGEDVLLNQKGEVIGNRNDFKMNTCILHSSGALLIDISSVSMLEKSFAARPASTPNVLQVGHAAPATEGNTQGNDNPASVTNAPVLAAQANPEMDVDVMDAAPTCDIAHGDDDYDDCHDAAPMSPVSTHVEGDQVNLRLREFQRRARLAEIAATKETWKDPWEELDPYATHKHMEKPFKKGKPFKLPPELKSLLTKQKKRKRDNGAPIRFGSTQLSPIVEFCGKDYCKSRTTNKLGGTMFSEFEYLARIENNKRREARRRERRLLASRLTTDQIADIESIAQPPTDDHDVDDDYDYNDGVDNNSIGDQDNMLENLGDDPFVNNLQEPMQDVVLSNYEELVRQYIGRYIEEAETYAQQTELSKRVKEWQDRILPVLENEEQHRPFDIHNYGSEILHSFEDSTQKTFNDIVRDKERHEVCRYFLSTLLLANMNNLEILQSETELEMDMMNLRLIDKNPAYKAISNYKAPSLQD